MSIFAVGDTVYIVGFGTQPRGYQADTEYRQGKITHFAHNGHAIIHTEAGYDVEYDVCELRLVEEVQS